MSMRQKKNERLRRKVQAQFSDEVRQINATILNLQDQIREQQRVVKLLQKNIKASREAVKRLKEERRLVIVAGMSK